jgi:hypothetical protein
MRGCLALVVVGACASLAGASGVGAASDREAAGTAAYLVTRNVHWHRPSIGGLLLFGEVVNRGNSDAANVGVLAELFNPAGERLARGATLRISVNVLRPRATAVWIAQMSDEPKKWSRMKVLAGEQIGGDEMRKQDYTSFKVKGVKIAEENPGFSQVVTGTVLNSGKKPAKVADVAVALYQGPRLVWVTDQGFLYPYSPAQDLPPGKSAPFKASILGYLKKPTRIVTYVRASTKGPNGLYPS